ncbi:MAG: hypothetical protein JXA18_11520, partial [Chitinispirillaceae bacterium]|nr:hypothetical protein [Chitinispirillaceae bacterium]
MIFPFYGRRKSGKLKVSTIHRFEHTPHFDKLNAPHFDKPFGLLRDHSMHRPAAAIPDSCIFHLKLPVLSTNGVPASAKRREFHAEYG